MDVAIERVTFLTNDECHFGMSLEAHHSVHHVHTRAFELMRPMNVAFFIKARLELNQHDDLFSALGRMNQKWDKRAVITRAIQRHFDCENFRIINGLADEFFDARRKALVRVMHHQVASADHAENIVTRFL